MSEKTEKSQHPVETVEEFKVRIAAIIHAKSEQIPAPRPRNPVDLAPKSERRIEKLNGKLPAFMHFYEVRPRKDHRGVDLISDQLP